MADTQLERSGTERAKTAGMVMVAWVALLWALEAIDIATGHALDPYGVTPRDLSELRDIVPSAFLHDGFGHVAANTVPLLVLGFLAALRGIRRFAGVVAMIILAAGLGVWLTSPATPSHWARRASSSASSAMWWSAASWTATPWTWWSAW